MSFLSKISAYDGADVAPEVSREGQRSVGRSLASYLRGDVMGRIMDSVARGRGDDSQVMGVACHLSSLSRSARREYLTRMSPVVRRKLLDIGTGLQRMVKDSAIDYPPQLCWAIGSVMDDGLGDGYQWLNGQGALPREVSRWFDSYKVDPFSVATRRAAGRLGRYRLVHDDARLSEYMDGVSAQEEDLQGVVDEGAELGAGLSEAATEALASIHESVEEKTSSFLSSLLSTYEEGIADVISQEVMEVTGGRVDDILEEDVDTDVESVVPDEDGDLVEEATLDEDLDNDPFDNNFGAGDDGGVDAGDGVGDAAPRHARRVRGGRSRRVRDAAVEEASVVVSDPAVVEDVVVGAPVAESPEDVPATPFAVGVPVQVSYMGNLYNGRVSAAGNGSIVVEGLPFEYFTARSANGSFTGTMADMTFGEGDVALLEAAVAGDPVSAVEDIPAGGDGFTEEEDILEVTDSIKRSDLEGYDAAKAEALAGELGIAVDALEYDGRYYINSGDDGGVSYLVLEQEELEPEGLFASEADMETLYYYIYKGSYDSRPDRYSAHTEFATRDGSEVDFMDDLGYRGIGKLVSQVNTLSPGFFKLWTDVLTVGEESYEALCLGHPYYTDDVSPDVILLYDDEGRKGDYWYYKKLMVPDVDKTVILVESPSDVDGVRDALEYVVNIYESYGSPDKDQLGMLKQSLRAELTTPVGDGVEGAPVEVTAESVISSVVGGEDLSSEDDQYAILYDEGFVVFVTPDSTESVEESDAAAYLMEHAEVFGPALDLVFGSVEAVSDAEEDVTVEERALRSGEDEVAAGVTTREDINGDVVTVHEDVRSYTVSPEEWSSLYTAVQAWGTEWCFPLSQSVESAVRLSAATAFSSTVSGAGFSAVRVDATVPEVLLNDRSLAAFKVDGLYVGSTLFVYQTSDSGVVNFAESVASEVVSLGHKIMDYEDVTVSEEVSEDISEVHDDDGDGASLLTEAVKQEVVKQVEDKVKEALEKVGLAVEDSAPVVSPEELRAAAPNTYDIPHTASTFHRVRDYGRVMDSVLSVASELLGERVSASQYRSMLKSGSRKCAQKVQKVVDTAIMMDALDLVCPALYKERMTDSYWVCDSVADVEKVFKWKSGVSDGRCMVSKDPVEGADSFPVGKSSVYIKLL